MPHDFTFTLPINITAFRIGGRWEEADKVQIDEVLSADYLPEFRAFCSLIIANSVREEYRMLSTEMPCEELLSVTCDVLFSSKVKATLMISMIVDDTSIFPLNEQTSLFLAKHDLVVDTYLVRESLALCRFIKACMNRVLPNAISNLGCHSMPKSFRGLERFQAEMVYKYVLKVPKWGEYHDVEWAYSYLDIFGKNLRRVTLWAYNENTGTNEPYLELEDRYF